MSNEHQADKEIVMLKLRMWAAMQGRCLFLHSAENAAAVAMQIAG